MRPLKTISLLSLLFYLPLYAEEIFTTAPIVKQEPMPINKEEIILPKESESVVTPAPTSTTQELTIQELIEQVKSAPDESKRVLMNQLKVQLKTMNQESRHKAIKELRKSFIKKEMHTKQKNHETSQHSNHQPKFRHLQQGGKHNSTPQPGRGGGSGQQGNGQK